MSVSPLLYPDIYKDNLEKIEIYENFEEFIELENDEMNFLFTDEDVARETIESFIESFLEYLRGESENVEIEIDTSFLRDFFIEEIEKIEVCEEDTFLELNMGNLEEIEEIEDASKTLTCRPYEMSAEQFLDFLLEQTNTTDLFETISFDLLEVTEDTENIDKLREGVSIYKKSLWISLFAILIFITLGFFINRNNKKITLKAFSLTFIISGIIIIILSISIRQFSFMIIEMFPEIISQLSEFIQLLIRSIISRKSLIGILTLGLGIGGIIWTGKMQKPDQQESSKN